MEANKIKDFKSTKSIKEVDINKGVVQIYVSSFGNIDSDGDIIEKGAFTKTINENIKRIKHLKDHDRRLLMGYPEEMKEDDFGLLVTSRINLKKQWVMDVFEDYKFFADGGRTLEHSIGFGIVKGYYDQSRTANILTELSLAEYSTLSFLGANENTPLVDIKSMSEAIEVYNYLNQMLKGKYSDERLATIENLMKQLKPLLSNEPVKPLESQIEPDNNQIKLLSNILTIVKNG